MTIVQLEYIVSLDTQRNFAKAADQCFVTQPTLSMQIKKLEEELNVILFDRNKKPVMPTDIGMRVIEQARLTLQSIKKIEGIIQHHADDLSGILRIGIIPTLSPYLLPRLLPSLSGKYPKMQLVLEELLSEQIIEKLHKDLLDIGIWVADKEAHYLVHVPLFYEKFMVYFPEGHPYQEEAVALSELDMNQMWLLKEGHCFRDQVEKFCGSALMGTQHLNFLNGSLETLKKMVDQQYGFTLLPELAVYDLTETQQKNVKHFKQIKPLREISLTYHQRFSKEMLVRVLKDEIRQSVPVALLSKNRGDVVQWRLTQ